MAEISVIIPCYNVEKYIDRCLESVFNQTFPTEKIEIICVDDGSTDCTNEKLKFWEKNYPDNILIVEADNRRSGGARNIGLGYASGKWIAFLDSDDWIEQSYLERLYEVGEAGNFEVVNCSYIRDKSENLSYLTKEENQTYTTYEIDSLQKRKEFFHAQCLKLYVWAKLIKRDFLIDNDIYFQEGLAYEDIAWGNLIHLYVRKAANISDTLYHYVVNDNSLVLRKNSECHTDHIVAVEEMWQDWERRGLFDTLCDELEYEYYYNGYLAFLKILALRYDSSQYSLFRLLKQVTVSKGIDIDKNIYLSNESIPQFHKELIKASTYSFSKKEYDDFIELIKKIGL